MTVARARLVKRSTEDGLVEIRDHVPLGKIYRVVIETRRTVTLYNSVRRVRHKKEIIDEVSGRWLPVECLRIEQERKLA